MASNEARSKKVQAFLSRQGKKFPEIKVMQEQYEVESERERFLEQKYRMYMQEEHERKRLHEQHEKYRIQKQYQMDRSIYTFDEMHFEIQD